eukprot:TRINITY_DN6601_c0_g1_i1.p1 TRINITY_DN6601_c0_g1~~TRINITY_DN6601_c0_g1_i1.p1  ORF type:complete len:155 (-),score=10.33 TRINITY_DN6601_c0_g1_i1:416-823(-)
MLAVPSGGQMFTDTASLSKTTAGTNSSGTGFAVVVLMYGNTSISVSTNFTGLTGNTTMAHIHCCTTSPGTGSAGPATPLPSLPGFPLGVMSGSSFVDLDVYGIELQQPLLGHEQQQHGHRVQNSHHWHGRWHGVF